MLLRWVWAGSSHFSSPRPFVFRLRGAAVLDAVWALIEAAREPKEAPAGAGDAKPAAGGAGAAAFSSAAEAASSNVDAELGSTGKKRKRSESDAAAETTAAAELEPAAAAAAAAAAAEAPPLTSPGKFKLKKAIKQHLSDAGGQAKVAKLRKAVLAEALAHGVFASESAAVAAFEAKLTKLAKKRKIEYDDTGKLLLAAADRPRVD
jgi:hypothetical protein